MIQHFHYTKNTSNFLPEVFYRYLLNFASILKYITTSKITQSITAIITKTNAKEFCFSNNRGTPIISNTNCFVLFSFLVFSIVP